MKRVFFIGSATVERVQPAAVNTAGKRGSRVCRPLAGAEMQKAPHYGEV